MATITSGQVQVFDNKELAFSIARELHTSRNADEPEPPADWLLNPFQKGRYAVSLFFSRRFAVRNLVCEPDHATAHSLHRLCVPTRDFGKLPKRRIHSTLQPRRNRTAL